MILLLGLVGYMPLIYGQQLGPSALPQDLLLTNILIEQKSQ